MRRLIRRRSCLNRNPKTRPVTSHTRTRLGQPGHTRAMATRNSLFTNVRYYLPSSLSQELRNQTRVALDSHGATEVTSINEDPTHIITNSIHFEGWQSVSSETFVVSVSL
jgi:hypothetical protein